MSLTVSVAFVAFVPSVLSVAFVPSIAFVPSLVFVLSVAFLYLATFMSLLLTMLPFYLLGNLHCIGMCGPLVMMLGRHPYRYFYFLGRTFSFALAGMIAGEMGAILQIALIPFHLSALLSFFFGVTILLIGFYSFAGWQYPGHQWLARRLASVNGTLSLLLLKERAFPAFLFGFFTIALPCGQTLIVFSACALSGSAWIGLINGLVFALLTSPSLFAAMHAHLLLRRFKHHYNKILGLCALFIGTLALCRSFAELGWIDHLVLNSFHLVIY